MKQACELKFWEMFWAVLEEWGSAAFQDLCSTGKMYIPEWVGWWVEKPFQGPPSKSRRESKISQTSFTLQYPQKNLLCFVRMSMLPIAKSEVNLLSCLSLGFTG